MDWDKFLINRANNDLSNFNDYDTIIKNDKHLIVNIKDGKIKYEQLYDDKFNIFEPRQKFIEKMFNKLDLTELQDCRIPINMYDSYEWNSKNFSFVWSKPFNKPGLLFPYLAFDDWESTVKKFDDNYIPFQSRSNEPYFYGQDSTSSRSNIRDLLQKLYPNYITLNNPILQQVTDLMKYKIAFDIPGARPWSVRSAYIALSGSVSLRVIQYNPRWNEKTWIQFYEDINDIKGIEITSNYDKPLSTEIITNLKTTIDKQIKKSLKKEAEEKANQIRNKMRDLKTDHILNYIKHIVNYIGNKQNI